MKNEYALPLTGNEIDPTRLNRLLLADPTITQVAPRPNLNIIIRIAGEYNNSTRRIEKIIGKCPAAYKVLVFTSTKVIGKQIEDVNPQSLSGCLLIYSALAEKCDDISDNSGQPFSISYNSGGQNSPRCMVERGVEMVKSAWPDQTQRRIIVPQLEKAIYGYIEAEDIMTILTNDLRNSAPNHCSPLDGIYKFIKTRNRGFGDLAVAFARSTYGAVLPPESEQRIRSIVLYTTLLDYAFDKKEDRNNGQISLADLMQTPGNWKVRRVSLQLNRLMNAVGRDIGDVNLGAFLSISYKTAMIGERLGTMFSHRS